MYSQIIGISKCLAAMEATVTFDAEAHVHFHMMLQPPFSFETFATFVTLKRLDLLVSLVDMSLEISPGLKQHVAKLAGPHVPFLHMGGQSLCRPKAPVAQFAVVLL